MHPCAFGRLAATSKIAYASKQQTAVLRLYSWNERRDKEGGEETERK